MAKPQIKLYLMGADAQLRKHLPNIRKTALVSIDKIAAALPLKQDVDVVVYRYKHRDKNFVVSGYAPTPNIVWIYIDPAHAGFHNLMKHQLPKVLAHELHHSCRFQGPGFGRTLSEVLITEGLAGHFELEMFGGKPAEFYIKFESKEIKHFWSRAQSILNLKQFSYDDWFFGNKKQNIPKHAGYALAYWLTSRISEKPSKLALTPANKIIKKIKI